MFLVHDDGFWFLMLFLLLESWECNFWNLGTGVCMWVELVGWDYVLWELCNFDLCLVERKESEGGEKSLEFKLEKKLKEIKFWIFISRRLFFTFSFDFLFNQTKEMTFLPVLECGLGLTQPQKLSHRMRVVPYFYKLFKHYH